MKHPLALALAVVSLVACSDKTEVNTAAEPAAAVDPAGLTAGPPTGSSDTRVAGTGPGSFVGRWAADVSWCANPQGERTPLEITPVRFDGLGKRCHIYSVDQTATGYLADLKCESQGGVRDERIHLAVSDEVLTVTHPDQAGQRIKLNKCTTLGDIAPTQALAE